MSMHSSFLLRLLLTGMAAGSAGASSHGQSYRLSGPLPPGPGGGDVRELIVSSDGTRAVYRADEETFGLTDLFAAPSDGSAPAVKLSHATEDYDGVREHGFALSPDGTRAVYLAAQEARLEYELYSAPSDGSANGVKLNGSLHGDGISAFEIAPDGSRVVYLGDQITWHQLELFSAPIDGSGPSVRLSGTLPDFSDVSAFHLDPTGRAVYLADAAEEGRLDLFSTPVDGSAAPLQLTHVRPSETVKQFVLASRGGMAVFVQRMASPAGDALFAVPLDGSGPLQLTPIPYEEIASAHVDPTGTRAVYRARSSAPGPFELHSVPLDGPLVGPPARLHPPLAAGRSGVEEGYDVTADGARVLFLADVAADGDFELWSAPITAATPAVRLNGALVPNGDVVSVSGVSRVTAGERVVYVADQDTLGVTELYAVCADGSAPAVKLNGPLVSAVVRPYSNDPLVPGCAFGTDPSRAVFALDITLGVDALTELFSVPVDASAAPVRLNGVLPPGGSVLVSSGWDFAEDRVLFVADQETDGVAELYSAPLDGAPGRTKLNGPMAPSPPAVSVYDFMLTGGTVRVVYVIGAPLEDWQLCSVLADGSGVPVVLDPAVSYYSTAFDATPDGSRVVYSTSTGGTARLYSVPADGSTTPLLLLTGPYPVAPRITPDGAYCVQATDEKRLLRVAIDGSSPPVYLTTAPVDPAHSSLVYAFSASGERVVFRQDHDVAGMLELYSVPLDASAAAVKLNPPLPATGDVGAFAISPDGAGVVYLADQVLDHHEYLYGVPILGGPAQLLSGAMVSGGRVAAFRIAPNGSRVAYVADKVVNERFELFSVSLTGGIAVKLNRPLVTGGDVGSWPYEDDFEFSPDGTRVVYLADQEVDERFELFGVPAAGGPAVKLNRTLAPGERIGPHPLISPDSRFVVFNAGNHADQRYEVFRRRLDGSDGPKKLNPPLPPYGSAGASQITPDGLQVLYYSDARQDGVLDLFSVPIGGGEPRRLNGPLPPLGDVGPCTVSHDSRTVVYRADQDYNAVYELYGSSLRTRVRIAPPP